MRIRVVLDANIYVSALMNPFGTPAQVLRSIIEEGICELVSSKAIFAELQRILFYPKIHNRIKKTDAELLAWQDALGLISYIVEPLHAYPTLVLEDPDDDIYLVAALESRARYIVSRDQHLLKIATFEGVQIVKASEFLKMAL